MRQYFVTFFRVTNKQRLCSKVEIKDKQVKQMQSAIPFLQAVKLWPQAGWYVFINQDYIHIFGSFGIQDKTLFIIKVPFVAMS